MRLEAYGAEREHPSLMSVYREVAIYVAGYGHMMSLVHRAGKGYGLPVVIDNDSTYFLRTNSEYAHYKKQTAK